MKEHDFEADKALAKEFLANFTDASGGSKYLEILQEVANRKSRAIQVDLHDLINYKGFDEFHEFMTRLTENTRRYVSIFSSAIDELLPEPTEAFPDDDHDILMTQRADDGTDNADVSDPRQQIPSEIKRFYEVYFKAPSKGRPSTIREVKASHIGQLVRIAGIVTRCSDVKPLMAVAVYTCEDCGHEIYQEVTSRVFMPLFKCPSSRCRVNSKAGNPILQLRASKFLKFQEVLFWFDGCSFYVNDTSHEGADDEYDSTCKTVKELEFSLTKHLKEQRKLLGDASIKYVTVGKDEYLLEVPESLSGSVPQDYELCSSKKGVFRYWTPTIKKLLKELAQAKSEKESALKSISQRLIGRFCEHQEDWRQLVSATAELDVLISLAFASDSYEGERCRPVISGSTSIGVPHLSATGLGHPVLRGDSLGRGSFVPNDVKIGGSKQASFILLTGPNMGGKSTLLRQVCLAVILAQIGADVPAETFELSPVDRIFVRMGAKDHIMAGQSTFLTELSETAVMLSSATRNSLVVLDELGRGTATSDGQAIAESVLEHFIDKVQCRGMFSTHYYRLSMDYQTNPQVSLCHMGCQVGEGSGGVEEVTFLYRLTPGACPKSYGVNVARLAGLPDDVLQRAVVKSQEFEGLYGKNHKKADRKMAEMIKQIISGVASDSDTATSKHLLSELHYKANTYLRLTN